MHKFTKRQLAASLILVPSFYGFVTWSIALGFYLLRLIEWYESPSGTVVLYFFVAAAFGCSTLFFVKAYAESRYRPEFDYETQRQHKHRYVFLLSNWALWALHVLGFIGLVLHFSQVVDSLAGLGGLLVAIFQDSYLIRQTEVDPLGIYLSYFGWLAIPLTVLSWRIEPKGMKLLLLAAAIQFGTNMLFIDRTRPIWLLFASFVIWFPFAKQMQLRSLLVRGILVASVAVVLFFAIGYWIGKRGEWFDFYGHVKVGNEIALLYYYLTGGFAYFDVLFDSSFNYSYIPERSLYPLYKIGELLRINDPPPTQILQFVEAPFPTNVGTMLEPLYSDGGMLFVVLGVIGATFLVDFVGLICIRARNALCLVFWAHLCVVSLLAFFVPKQNATQIWLFGTLAMIGFLISRFGRKYKDPFRTLSNNIDTRAPFWRR